MVDSSVLLVKHEKNGKSYWLLPGGGVRVGESAREALKRELYEELTLEAEVGDLLFVVETWSDDGTHIIQPTFLLELGDVNRIDLGGDRRVVGFDMADAAELLERRIYPDIKREIVEYIKNKAVAHRYLYKQWVE
ncbi:MAG: NUDIX domain-containing protein [Spirochaetes bacterium]|nr:NUDIX domain-containing protein [Spirochaetota bacterium]